MQKMQISGTPEFHDVVLLSKHSPQTAPYQTIPLGIHSQVSIDFAEENIQLLYQEHCLKIQGGKNFTEEHAFDIIKNFAVKDGNKVAFLANCPPVSQKKKKAKSLETYIHRAQPIPII